MHTNNDTLHVAVAESSVIIRGGVTAALKRISPVGTLVHPVEIPSMEALVDCMQMHAPEVLVVNPLFGGGFPLQKMKQVYPGTRYIALLTSYTDPSLLTEYDETLSVFDSLETITQIVCRSGDLAEETEEVREGEEFQEALSEREKEIVVCVVKGMTNKEIADVLFLSVHTVITHRRNISRKLQIHSAAGLTIYAIVNKLVDLKDVK